MSIKSEYVESKRAHDDAMAKYDAHIADLDIQGMINRATTIEELSTIEARVNDLSREYHIRDLRAEMNIAAQDLIDWSLDVAQAMRPRLDLRGLRGNDTVRAKLIELALTLPVQCEVIS